MNKIFVTKPYLPKLDELLPYLEEIWSSGILSNGGAFHRELEDKLCNYLGVDHISLFANGTLGLIAAMRALEIEGEVITTPFSFVATANAIKWANLKPVFVDIDKNTFNIDPDKIEEAITEKTTAIVPVHCYGIPCEVEKIEKIAQKYNLKVVYDAAHAFGVKHRGNGIMSYGDFSVLSFHATKVFNTFEGGAVVSKTKELKQRVDLIKNFGIVDEGKIVLDGFNGKMSELNSAVGLVQLKHVDTAIQKRKCLHGLYCDLLSNIRGLKFIQYSSKTCPNYSYFPIVVGDEYVMTRDELTQYLNKHDIFPRKYFYPLLSDLKIFDSSSNVLNNLAVAKHISERVLCLPLYPDLNVCDLKMIAEKIRCISGA